MLNMDTSKLGPHLLECEQMLRNQTLLNNHKRHLYLTTLCLEHHHQVK